MSRSIPEKDAPPRFPRHSTPSHRMQGHLPSAVFFGTPAMPQAYDTPEPVAGGAYSAPFKFGIFYPQGQGWLHVEKLENQGWGNSVTLVCSATDPQLLCLKKRTRVWFVQRQCTSRVLLALRNLPHDCHYEQNVANILRQTPPKEEHHREIIMYRPHELIPPLREWAETSLINVPSDPEAWQKMSININIEARITSTVTQHCNGGKLVNLVHQLDAAGKIRLPELGWRCFSDLLDIVVFYLLCECSPGVCHADLSARNIFLQFANDEEKFPRFLLANFGDSILMKGNLQNPANLSAENFNQISVALYGVTMAVFEVVMLVPPTDLTFGQDAAKATGHVAEALRDCVSDALTDGLRECLQELVKVADHFGQSHRWQASSDESILERLWNLKSYVNEQNRNLDLTYLPSLQGTKPSMATTPKLWDSPEELLARNNLLDGPWKIVAVDPETYEILAVDNTLHGRMQTNYDLGDQPFLHPQAPQGQVTVYESVPHRGRAVPTFDVQQFDPIHSLIERSRSIHIGNPEETSMESLMRHFPSLNMGNNQRSTRPRSQSSSSSEAL